jgi:hypothetical protein
MAIGSFPEIAAKPQRGPTSHQNEETPAGGHWGFIRGTPLFSLIGIRQRHICGLVRDDSVSAVLVNDCPKWIDRMIVVSDAVAEIDWTTHEARLTIMNRIFAGVKTTDEVVQIPQLRS